MSDHPQTIRQLRQQREQERARLRSRPLGEVMLEAERAWGRRNVRPTLPPLTSSEVLRQVTHAFGAVTR